VETGPTCRREGKGVFVISIGGLLGHPEWFRLNFGTPPLQGKRFVLGPDESVKSVVTRSLSLKAIESVLSV